MTQANWLCPAPGTFATVAFTRVTFYAFRLMNLLDHPSIAI
jgi:hypothetical protein